MHVFLCSNSIRTNTQSMEEMYSAEGLYCPSFLSASESESEVAQLCPTLCDPMEPARLLHPWDFLGKNTGVDCHFLLQPQLHSPFSLLSTCEGLYLLLNLFIGWSGKLWNVNSIFPFITALLSSSAGWKETLNLFLGSQEKAGLAQFHSTEVNSLLLALKWLIWAFLRTMPETDSEWQKLSLPICTLNCIMYMRNRYVVCLRHCN